MSKVRVHNLAVSLDGFATGEGQSLEAPFGHAGTRLMDWFFPTATFQGMSGDRERQPVSLAAQPDDRFARHWGEDIGAEIMGANKFGPPGWHEDPEWRGWWGENPPFHTPVVVLTHHERPPLECERGTTFYFVISPIILGRGVRLWDGLEGVERDFDVASETTPSGVTHITFTKGEQD